MFNLPYHRFAISLLGLLLLSACSQESKTTASLPPPAASTPATGQDDFDADKAKVALIERLYAQAKQQNAGFEIVPDDVLSADFRRALQQEAHHDDDEACIIPYDPLWQSQDPQTDVAVAVQLLPDGRVKAAFSQYDEATAAIYALECTATDCLISDIYDSDGIDSLKAGLTADCPAPE